MKIETFSNQVLFDFIDYFFQFIQTKRPILKDLKLEEIIYQKELLVIYSVIINGIRCRSKINSTKRICWIIKNVDFMNADKAESTYFNDFRKNAKNENRKSSRKCQYYR